MKKLKLELENLSVESFATHGGEGADGTVRAPELSGSYPDTRCYCSRIPDSHCLCTAEAEVAA